MFGSTFNPDQLPDFEYERLFNMYKTCIKALADSKNQDLHAGAETRISMIECEWVRRTTRESEWYQLPKKKVLSGDNSLFAAGWSDKGPLSLLGYQVGIGGKLAPFRRKLLDRVFTRPIPPLNTPNYLVEWDAPATPGRLRKLTSSISSFSILAVSRKGTSLAVSRWRADLEYLLETYGKK